MTGVLSIARTSHQLISGGSLDIPAEELSSSLKTHLRDQYQSAEIFPLSFYIGAILK